MEIRRASGRMALVLCVLGAVSVRVCAASSGGNQPDIPERYPTLWYPEEAKEWVEALPVGNGRLGAMVFGGVTEERLQLNEDTLWSGRPHDYTNPNARQYLQQVRDLIFAGQYAQAQQMVDAHMMGVPRFLQAYQTLGDLRLTFSHADGVTDYRRHPGPGVRHRHCHRDRSIKLATDKGGVYELDENLGPQR